MSAPVSSSQFDAAVSDATVIDTNEPVVQHASAQELLAANINPRTGLATDYLNHFNEAVMLLDMIPDMPECVDDFLGWQPLSYIEHFCVSNFSARSLAINAYRTANESVRREFDTVIATLTSVLTVAADAMRHARSQRDESCADVAIQSIDRAKALIMIAGGLINGANGQADIDGILSD